VSAAHYNKQHTGIVSSTSQAKVPQRKPYSAEQVRKTTQVCELIQAMEAQDQRQGYTPAPKASVPLP